MTRKIIDSYTQTELGEEYKSSIPGIMEGRHDFYRPEGCAVYELAPAAGEWIVLRNGGGASSGMPLFLSHPTRAIAQSVMDWLITNDGSVRIALYWIARKNLDPYFRLLTFIQEVALGQRPNPRQHRIFSDTPAGDSTDTTDAGGDSGADAYLYDDGKGSNGGSAIQQA